MEESHSRVDNDDSVFIARSDNVFVSSGASRVSDEANATLREMNSWEKRG